VGYTRASETSPLVKFDSTLDRGTGPLLFKHGSGRLVQGLEEAIHTTTVGEIVLTILLFCHYSYKRPQVQSHNTCFGLYN